MNVIIEIILLVFVSAFAISNMYLNFTKGKKMARRLQSNEVVTITRKCNVCKDLITFDVNKDGYELFNKGMHVQEALPNVSAGYREMLLSGICPKCWDEMFK